MVQSAWRLKPGAISKLWATQGVEDLLKGVAEDVAERARTLSPGSDIRVSSGGVRFGRKIARVSNHSHNTYWLEFGSVSTPKIRPLGRGLDSIQGTLRR